MTTMSLIKRHVHRLARGELFTTRDLLNYGSRSNVDYVVYRLIQSKRIARLARGVFIRADDLHKRTVSAFDVASVKANAFGKNIMEDAASLAVRLKIRSGESQPPYTMFATSGCSSSLVSCRGVIRFKATAPRKMALGAELDGQTLRALWCVGRRTCKEDLVRAATLPWNRVHKEGVRKNGKFLPQWLHKFFYRQLRITHIKADHQDFQAKLERKELLRSWYGTSTGTTD